MLSGPIKGRKSVWLLIGVILKKNEVVVVCSRLSCSVRQPALIKEQLETSVRYRRDVGKERLLLLLCRLPRYILTSTFKHRATGFSSCSFTKLRTIDREREREREREIVAWCSHCPYAPKQFYKNKKHGTYSDEGTKYPIGSSSKGIQLHVQRAMNKWLFNQVIWPSAAFAACQENRAMFSPLQQEKSSHDSLLSVRPRLSVAIVGETNVVSNYKIAKMKESVRQKDVVMQVSSGQNKAKKKSRKSKPGECFNGTTLQYLLWTNLVH